jgi:hypothetical protein
MSSGFHVAYIGEIRALHDMTVDTSLEHDKVEIIITTKCKL